jgi:hypothetical protein
MLSALQHSRTLCIKDHSDGGRIVGLLQLLRKLCHPHGQSDARGNGPTQVGESILKSDNDTICWGNNNL